MLFILQGIVDSSLKCIHATVGYPGSIHDARVLRLSGLYDMAQNEQILSGPTRDINGVEIGPLLAGGSAYPLTSWLTKPFPDRGRLTPEQRRPTMCGGACIWHVKITVANCYEKN